MKTKILGCLTLIMIMTACKKDKFQTAPTLTLKSTSSRVVGPNGVLNVRLELTDKEGDISDTLYILRTRNNALAAPLLAYDTAYQIPEVVDTRSVEINLALAHRANLQMSSGNRNDSITLHVYVTDKANNKSNIIDIDNVVVLK